MAFDSSATDCDMMIVWFMTVVPRRNSDMIGNSDRMIVWFMTAVQGRDSDIMLIVVECLAENKTT